MSNRIDEELFAELEAAVQKQQETASDTHDEILKTINELHDALDSLAEREHSRTQDAASWSDDTRQQLQTVRNTVDRSVVESNEAEGRLEAARARIQELELELKSAEERGKRLQTAEGRIVQLGRDLAERDEAVASAETTRERLEKMEMAYNEQAEAIEAGQAAKRRAAELETTLEEYKTLALADRERSADLESQIAEFASQIEGYEADRAGLEGANERLAALETEHEGLREQLAATESQLAAAQDEAETARREAAEFEDQLSSQSAALEEEQQQAQDQAQAKLKALRTQVREAEESAQESDDALTAAKSALSEMGEAAEEVKALTKTVAKLEDWLGAAEKRSQALGEKVEKERVKRKRSVLAEQLTEVLKELEESHLELEDLRGQLGLDSRKEDASDAVEEEVNADVPAEYMRADTPPQEDTEKKTGPRLTRYSESRRRMGQILLQAGVLSEEQLEEALAYQHEEGLGRHLGTIVVALGMAQEEVIARAVAHQSEVEYFEVAPVLIDAEAASLISVRLAEMHTCIPVREEGGKLLLAMENPMDLIAIEDVERASERRVRPVVASVGKILECIDMMYDDTLEGT